METVHYRVMAVRDGTRKRTITLPNTTPQYSNTLLNLSAKMYYKINHCTILNYLTINHFGGQIATLRLLSNSTVICSN